MIQAVLFVRYAMHNQAAIGVFDSGLGGISVLHEIRHLLPYESLIYIADSAHVPYGEKSAEFIVQRSIAISEFLLAQPVKAIVVACNTATAAAGTDWKDRSISHHRYFAQRTLCGSVGALCQRCRSADAAVSGLS